MEVDWQEVFHPYIEGEVRKMKFSILPKVFSWTSDLQENIDLTVEWLIREGKADDVRLSLEPVVASATNGWYTVESEPGQFLHCCYPADMLKFRGQYETLREQLVEVDVQTLSVITQTAESARTLLWSAWGCLGGDGSRVAPYYPPDNDADGIPVYRQIVPPSEWPRVWNYRCYKCCEDLPKSLKLWQKMQHSRLKEIA